MTIKPRRGQAIIIDGSRIIHGVELRHSEQHGQTTILELTEKNAFTYD